MAYENQIKCPKCGVSVPDVPEDASYEEMLCNQCTECGEVKGKPTPGPWFPKMYRGRKRPTWGVRNAMFSICNLVEQDMENVENGEECATAYLIATAPELLAVLKRAADYMGEMGHPEDVLRDARTVIAKAEPPTYVG